MHACSTPWWVTCAAALLLALPLAAARAAWGEVLYLLDAAAPLPAESTVWDRITIEGTEFVIASCPGPVPAADVVRGAVEPGRPEEGLYIVSSPGPLYLIGIEGLGDVAARDTHAALLRATAAGAEEIAARGMELRAVLPPPPRAAPLRARAASAARGPLLAWDSRVQGIIDAVMLANLETLIGDLTGVNSVTVGGAPYTIATRTSTQAAPISKATQYCYEYFQNLGLPASYDDYTWGEYSWRNVVAEQPGTVSPEGIYLVCAHLDDMPPGATAPGADDNASGSAAVLRVASVLREYAFEYTLRYVLFTGEEQGLIGSYYYVQDCAGAGDSILGVLNLDMIAYDGDSHWAIDLHCGTIAESGEIGDLFISTVADYGLSLVPEKITTGSSTASDHSRFWDAGYPAILGIEDFDDFNPHYHTVNDTRANCVLPYATEFTKAAAGTLAQLGGLVSETPTPTPTPSPTPTPPRGYVNFQPTSVTPLPWYWPDYGSPFGAQGEYGWLAP